MAQLKIAIPSELQLEMANHPEIDWSEIAADAIRERLDLLRKMDALLKDSRLTEKDALELGKKVNRKVAKKYQEML